jgi:methylmalonyl-CoA mutase C-terminal domain/subunit
MNEKKIRVLVGKPGLDGHDRGAMDVARALRDAGMEVIYTGLRKTPEMIAESDLQEDVGIVLGGIIPEEDILELKALGVAEVFGPGTNTEEIIRTVVELAGVEANDSD